MEVVARMEGPSCHCLYRVRKACLMEVVVMMKGRSTLATAFAGWNSLAIHPLLCKGGLQKTPYPRDPRLSLQGEGSLQATTMGWVAGESFQYPFSDFSPPIPFVSFFFFFFSFIFFLKRYANMTEIYKHITTIYRSYLLIFCTSEKRVTIDRHKH